MGWSPPPYPRADAAGAPTGLPRNASQGTDVRESGMRGLAAFPVPKIHSRDALPAHTEPRLQTQPPAPGVHQGND